jgi:hypothetical protein
VGADSMNKQIIALLAAVIAAVLGAIIYLAKNEQSTVEAAQKLIANPPQLPPNGEMVFRKPKSAGYMLILLFVSILVMAAYGVIRSGGLFRIEGIRAGVIVLVAVSPLVMGIRSLRYTVRVSTDALVISDATTKYVRLRDISEVNIEPGYRGGRFCRIALMTGEEDLQVTSDLENFPEFVSLLCNSVDEIKGNGATGRATDS